MGSAESTSSDVLMPSTNDMPAWVLVVFEFSDWRTRAHLMQVSKRWRHNTSDPQFFRFLARRLSLEHAIYIPPQLPSNDTWRGFFFDMYKLRHVWTPEAASGGSGGAISTSVSASGAAESVLTAEGTEEEGVDKAEALPYESHKGAEPAGERFKISVIARFRPGVLPNQGGQGQGDGGTGGQGVVVTLPLHQRLAMIRMSRRLSSNKQALRVLTSEGGWFGSRWSQLSASSASSTPTASASAASTSGGDKENNSINNISSGISSINITPLNHHATKGGATFDADSKVPKFVREMCAERARVALRGVNTAQGVEQGVGGLGGHGQGGQEEGEGMGMGGMVAAVQSVDAMTGRVVMVAPDVGLREFSFDSVLPASSSQTRTYNTCARRLVVDFINGFNATAIVYGQTGSGKTYSMFGLGGEQSNENGEPGNTGTAAFRENMGIVPRACEEIFAAVAARRESGVEAEVSVSYVEVFGDEVSDLMRNGARCGHSKVASQQYVLSGAAEKAVTTVTEINTLLAAGEKQKRRAATAMNERSTRAHSLFIVSLRQTRGTDVVLKSRLFLADLGGSEQVKKSKVEAGTHRPGLETDFSVGFELGSHMREAVNINLGLLALKKVIEALNTRALYTPYQDSKLTMLLSAGLGNSKTSVIVCANMDAGQIAETVATMRFGEKCALVETEARNNASMLEQVLRQLDEEITACEGEIRSKERWESRAETRADELAEEGTYEKMSGGVETKKISLLVGAEAERKRLEGLLIKRARFIGAAPIDEEGEIDGVAGGGGGGKGRRVVGFGKQSEIYGLGGGFDETAESAAANSRFEAAEAARVPAAVRARAAARAAGAQRAKAGGKGGGGVHWRDEVVKEGGKEGKDGGQALGMGWASGSFMVDAEDAETLQRKAQRVKRNRLAYSGISS